ARMVMSLSVNIPRSFCPSQTGIGPTSRSFIFRAASCSVASGSMTSTSRVITSLTFIVLSFPLGFTSPGPLPRGSGQGAILNSLDVLLSGAVGAAEDGVLCLHAMPQDHAVAMGAARSQRMDRALETV